MGQSETMSEKCPEEFGELTILSVREWSADTATGKGIDFFRSKVERVKQSKKLNGRIEAARIKEKKKKFVITYFCNLHRS